MPSPRARPPVGVRLARRWRSPHRRAATASRAACGCGLICCCEVDFRPLHSVCHRSGVVWTSRLGHVYHVRTRPIIESLPDPIPCYLPPAPPLVQPDDDGDESSIWDDTPPQPTSRPRQDPHHRPIPMTKPRLFDVRHEVRRPTLAEENLLTRVDSLCPPSLTLDTQQLGSALTRTTSSTSVDLMSRPRFVPLSPSRGVGDSHQMASASPSSTPRIYNRLLVPSPLPINPKHHRSYDRPYTRLIGPSTATPTTPASNRPPENFGTSVKNLGTEDR
jgi:hypothetical protein